MSYEGKCDYFFALELPEFNSLQINYRTCLETYIDKWQKEIQLELSLNVINTPAILL